MADPPARRRFVPELVETTTTTTTTTTSSTSQAAVPAAPAEATTAQPKRRFVPELVENTSRRSNQPSPSSSPPPPPLPTSSPRTSLQKPARARFAPEPIETTSRSVRQKSNPELTEAPLLAHETMATTPKRKFTPQLIETAVRSRRAGDTLPAVLPSDKTNVTPLEPGMDASRLAPRPPANTPRHSAGRIPTLAKPWPMRQGSIRPHYNTRANTRQHSYMVPKLDDIESSESGGSRAPSLSRSNSAPSESDDEAYKHATRLRESVDDRFSGYLLALAARAAEKQLRDQEAAAFATSDYHQPVAHYVDDDASEEDSSPSPPIVPARREDSADEKTALQELQRHGERISKQKVDKAPKTQRSRAPERKKTGAFNVEFDGDVDQDAWVSPAAPKNLIGGYQKDPDLKQMRKAASPPMLGGDLEFPRCPSPEHARFDVTQGSEFLKASMNSLSEQGMWGGSISSAPKTSNTSKSGQSSCQSAKAPAGGLWGGFCTPKDRKVPSQPSSGLVTPLATPQVEQPDPFSMFAPATTTGASVAGKRPGPPPSLQQDGQSHSPLASGGAAPPSPPPSNSDKGNLLETAAAEAQLDRDFGDAFITQVFNYLSLGYPALARKFDDELSRISSVPVETLRQDDEMIGARGYIRLGEDADGEVDDLELSDCQRWTALRVYIREWGRQLVLGKNRNECDPHRAWGLPAGLPARKGSWGL